MDCFVALAQRWGGGAVLSLFLVACNGASREAGGAAGWTTVQHISPGAGTEPVEFVVDRLPARLVLEEPKDLTIQIYVPGGQIPVVVQLSKQIPDYLLKDKGTYRVRTKLDPGENILLQAR